MSSIYSQKMRKTVPKRRQDMQHHVFLQKKEEKEWF